MKKKQEDKFFDEYMQNRKSNSFYNELSSESLLITKIWDFNKTILDKWADIDLLIAINEAKTNRKMKKGLKNIANNLREIADNVLAKKNIADHDLIGIILELIYSNIIKIDEFLGISKKTIEYKNKNIRYLDELEKELENIYETLTGDTKKKEAFRKNVLDWVKKYIKYLNNKEKKTIKTTNPVKKEKVTLSGKRYISKEYIDNIEENLNKVMIII